MREAGLNCDTRPLALPDSLFLLLGRVFRQLRFWLKPSFHQKYPDFQIFFTKQIILLAGGPAATPTLSPRDTPFRVISA